MSSDFTLLLDKSTPFNSDKVKLLDELVKFFYANPNSPYISQANNILVQLQQDQDFWLNADTILESQCDNSTKFFALKVLEDAIRSKWQVLGDEQKNSIRTYMVSMVVKLGDLVSDKNSHFLLNKVNLIVVEIVKYEWNTCWKSFIPDLCEASKQNQNICENNLNLLKILSEEIFNFSKNQMTSTQIKELKETMQKEFGSLYELCYFIMKSYIENSSQVKVSLMEACLNTLHAFLSWIPLAYIFLTDLIEFLLQIFDSKDLKVGCLKCLLEIVILPVDNCTPEETKKIQEKIFYLYSNFIAKMGNVFSCEINLAQERLKLEKQKSHNLKAFDEFCQLLAILLSGFFRTHLHWIEPYANDSNNPDQIDLTELIKKGFAYLTQLSQLPESIFKICVEFWHDFTNTQLNQQQKKKAFDNDPRAGNLLLLTNKQEYNLQNLVYNLALIQVRSIIISRMAKPVEINLKVLLVIDETGRPIRETLENTENNSLYEILKELLINLAKLDWVNTKDIMLNKLEKQLDGTEFSFDNLNSLSWAIGSISGSIPANEEKQFLISTIRNLLTLCEQKKGKENKAVVASNIMYVVGQYPRFLKSNWNFLKTVIKKLFEFMHETYPGVMEMAVNTFLKISETCKEEFVILHVTNSKSDSFHQQTESEPYIDELIRKIPDETNLLEAEHKLVFYEAVGHMISCEKDFNRKQYLLQGVLELFWDTWASMLREIELNLEVLKNEKYIEQFVFIIKLNERLAYSVGNDFYKALAKIYIDLLKIYILYSKLIANELATQGKQAIYHYTMKRYRGVKKETLRMIDTFISKSDDVNMITQNFIPPLIDILEDYNSSPVDGREHEVLILFTTIVDKLKGNLTEAVPKVLDLIFGATLQMITQDFNSYQDHRVALFKFLASITNNCFQALFAIPADQFKTVIDCVLWAIKHELSSIFELGLESLTTILQNVNTDQNIANQFYQIFYMSLLKDIIFVLTDSVHRQGFKLQAKILSILFEILTTNYVTAPVDSNQGNNSNKEYVYSFLLDALSSTFPTLSKNQTSNYLNQLFQTCGNFNDFKIALRDFLIKMSQFDPEALLEGQNN